MECKTVCSWCNCCCSANMGALWLSTASNIWERWKYCFYPLVLGQAISLSIKNKVNQTYRETYSLTFAIQSGLKVIKVPALLSCGVTALWFICATSMTSWFLFLRKRRYPWDVSYWAVSKCESGSVCELAVCDISWIDLRLRGTINALLEPTSWWQAVELHAR